MVVQACVGAFNPLHYRLTTQGGKVSKAQHCIQWLLFIAPCAHAVHRVVIHHVLAARHSLTDTKPIMHVQTRADRSCCSRWKK